MSSLAQTVERRVESLAMTRRSFHKHQGVESRLVILLEIRRREDAGKRPPSMRELGEVADLSATTVLGHLRRLQSEGLVSRDPSSGKLNGLTTTGKLLTNYLRWELTKA